MCTHFGLYRGDRPLSLSPCMSAAVEHQSAASTTTRPTARRKKRSPVQLAELETATLEMPPLSPRDAGPPFAPSGAGRSPWRSPRAAARSSMTVRDLTADLELAVGWAAPRAAGDVAAEEAPAWSSPLAPELESIVQRAAATLTRQAEESEAQPEWLRTEGFTVRNTFIDGVPDNLQEGGATSSARRTSSAPPRMRPDDAPPASAKKGPGARPLPSPVGSTVSTSPGTPCGSLSGASASLSDCGWPGCGSCHEAPQVDEVDHPGAEAARAFVKTVADACGFLRIRGHDLLLHPRGSNAKWQSDVTLRVYVHGVPLAKRDRWQLPLRRAVIAALQKIGCAASMSRGEVYAPLEVGSMLRLDICALHD